MAAPALINRFDVDKRDSFEVTLARLKVLDPEKYAALKLIAEDAVRRALAKEMATRSGPT